MVEKKEEKKTRTQKGGRVFDELSACAAQECVFFFFFVSGAERAASPPSGKFSCEAEGPLGTDTEAHFHFETSLSAPFPLMDDSLSCVCAPACLSLGLSGSLPGL